MHSSLVRAQNVFGFFTTVAGFVALFVALSDLVAPRVPSVGTIQSTNVQVVKGRAHYYSSKKEEYAIIKFSLDADLSSLFNWNTKQVFVYVTAEWPEAPGATSPSSNATNQAVIWDKIITSPSADALQNIGPIAKKKLINSAKGKSIDPSRGLLRIKNQKPKYQITHPKGHVAEVDNVTLKLHYNVQPWVGILTWNQDRDYGVWQRLKGAVSKPFTLPPVGKKDAKKATKKVQN